MFGETKLEEIWHSCTVLNLTLAACCNLQAGLPFPVLDWCMFGTDRVNILQYKHTWETCRLADRIARLGHKGPVTNFEFEF